MKKTYMKVFHTQICAFERCILHLKSLQAVERQGNLMFERELRVVGMQELFKVVFLGIVGMLLALQFKSGKPEYGTYIGLGLAIVVFGYVLRQAGVIRNYLETLVRYLGDMKPYLLILMKLIGITYVCEFGSGICKDAGYQAIAGQIEILGKLSILYAGLPILLTVIEQINSFI